MMVTPPWDKPDPLSRGAHDTSHRRSLLEHKHRRDNVKDMLRKAIIFAACVTLAWAQDDEPDEDAKQKTKHDEVAVSSSPGLSH